MVMWPHLMVAVWLTVVLVVAVLLNGAVAPALSALAAAAALFSLGIVWTEARRMPPSFEPGLYAQRRAQLCDILGPPNEAMPDS